MDRPPPPTEANTWSLPDPPPPPPPSFPPPYPQSLTPPPRPGFPLPPWTIGDAVLCVIGGLVAGIVSIVILFLVLGQSGEPSYSVGYLILGGLTYGADLLVIWLLVFKRRKATWADIGFRPVKPWILFLMLPLTLPLLALTTIVAELTISLFGDVPGPADQLGVPSAGLSVVDFICLFAVVVVIGPVVEEIVFRGILYQVMRARKGIAFGLIVTSLTFAIIHFIPILLGVFILMGIAFALVTELTKSLYPAILLHALNNGVSVVLVYLQFN